jgi:hypothetical protein
MRVKGGIEGEKWFKDSSGGRRIGVSSSHGNGGGGGTICFFHLQKGVDILTSLFGDYLASTPYYPGGIEHVWFKVSRKKIVRN